MTTKLTTDEIEFIRQCFDIAFETGAIRGPLASVEQTVAMAQVILNKLRAQLAEPEPNAPPKKMLDV